MNSLGIEMWSAAKFSCPGILLKSLSRLDLCNTNLGLTRLVHATRSAGSIGWSTGAYDSILHTWSKPPPISVGLHQSIGLSLFLFYSNWIETDLKSETVVGRFLNSDLKPPQIHPKEVTCYRQSDRSTSLLNRTTKKEEEEDILASWQKSCLR